MNGRTNTTSVTEVVEGVQVALEAPTNLVLTPLNARVDLTWTDPVDKYAAPDGQTATNPWDNVAAWDHSIIVRKAGSAPTGPEDGELIYTETVRNQHQYTAYSDTNDVINNTLYYYAVFAITQLGTVSKSVSASCTPIKGIPAYHTTIPALDSGIPFLFDSDKIGDKLLLSLRSDNQSSTPIYAYSDLLTAERASDLPIGFTNKQAGVSSNSKYAVVAAGYGGRNYYGRTADVYTYTPELVLMTHGDAMNGKNQYAALASINEYVLIAGGTYSASSAHNDVYAFDGNMTKTAPTGLIESANRLSGISTKTHAVFSGGIVGSFGSDSVLEINAYDRSLTRTTAPEKLSYGLCDHGCATVDNYMIFGIGMSSDGPATINNIVEIYDTSLTKIGTRTLGETYHDIGTNGSFQSASIGSVAVVAKALPYNSGQYTCDYQMVMFDRLLTMQTMDNRVYHDYSVGVLNEYAIYHSDSENGIVYKIS